MSGKQTEASLFRHLNERPWAKSTFNRDINIAKNNQMLLQRLSLHHTLDSHRGCVNSVVWNDSGTTILSASDDHRLVVTEPFTKDVLVDINTSHTANIFSAKFLPNTGDAKIVSCAGDGMILYTDVERWESTHSCLFNCHNGTAYELLTLPGDANTFLSCGEDGCVRWFDLRMKERCDKSACKEDVLISIGYSVTSLSLNPVLPYNLAVGASDSTVRLFDLRMLSTFHQSQANPQSLEGLFARFSVPELEGKHRRITSVQYRPDGQEILASYSSDYIYIFNPNLPDAKKNKRLFVGGADHRDQNRKSRTLKSETNIPPMKKLRLRGDWSDTGPNARPEQDGRINVPMPPQPQTGTDGGQLPFNEGDNQQSGPTNLMQRMTDALSRMLNDPSTHQAMRSVQTNRGERRRPSSEEENSRETANSNTNDNDQSSSSTAVATAPETNPGEESENQSDENPLSNTNQPDSGENSNYSHQEPSSGATEESQISAQLNDQNQPAASAANQELSATSPNSERISVGIEATEVSLEPIRVEEGSPPSSSSPSGRSVRQSISNIHSSLSHLRNRYVARHQEEPDVSLRFSNQGVENSTISIASSRQRSLTSSNPGDAAEVEEEDPLPGPSSVVTHPGNSGRNPITGQRQRRRGVSGPPTGPSCDPPPSDNKIKEEALAEYEVGEDEEQDVAKEDMREILQPATLGKLCGHRNARTMIKEACWWGNNFILSGSDCGHVFGWDRQSGEMVLLLEADRHVVNCVRPNPFEPFLATSGIDYNIKLWVPNKEQAEFNKEAADMIVKRNEVMLEETRDTITVPATLMIRMLASLNQIRRGRLLPRVVDPDQPPPLQPGSDEQPQQEEADTERENSSQ